MASALGAGLIIAGKDLKLELRSRTAFLSSLAFTALVLAIFNFARDPTLISATDLAPGILWITFSFAGLLGLNRAFALELENRALEALLLAPVSRTSIYLGKAIANLVFVGLVEGVALPLFAIFFNVPILPVLGGLTLVIALATIGFVAVGTLLSAIAVSTRFAELMLPVLMLPFLVPPITGAVQVTSRLFAARPFAEMAPWLKLLAGYDIVVVVTALLIFEFTLDQ
ncbi:MAG TPA: heme exporter protein CcmB [Gemmatimonadales bacterium]|jgi:heme exporter protein B